VNLLRDVWSVLTPRQRRWVFAVQGLSMLMALTTVTGIASVAPFFAALGDPHLIEHSVPLHWLFLRLDFVSRLDFQIALGSTFIALVLLSNLVNFAGSYAMVRLSYRISTDLQSVLFAEYLSRPYGFHTRTNSAVLFNNIIYETNRLTKDILQSLFSLVTQMATVVFILAAVVALHPLAAVTMTVALGGGYALLYMTLRNWLQRVAQVQSQYMIDTTKTVNETFGAIKEITVLRIQSFFRARFEHSTGALGGTAAHAQVIYQHAKYVVESFAVVGLVATALIAGYGDTGLGPRLGELTFLGFAAYRLLPALQQVFAALVRLRAERGGLESIAPDLRLARAHAGSEHVVDATWKHRPSRDICLKSVSYRYETTGGLASDALTMTIPAGTVVGLVGASGSGKTTAVDLIAGLLVPDTGRLEVDGIAIDDGNRLDWQSRIAYVPQNVFLLDTSIAENIALGIPREAIDQQRLAAAAQNARLDAFVATLGEGFGHVIGERGVRLSGGQRQRIGIARALYAEASVLILDEASNALDPVTERELMETVLRLRGRYTIILIAHSPAMMRACDRTYECAGGRIIDSGPGRHVRIVRSAPPAPTGPGVGPCPAKPALT
jgi:ABC-type multidrug transport system fused ATPase/permease subunit